MRPLPAVSPKVPREIERLVLLFLSLTLIFLLLLSLYDFWTLQELRRESQRASDERLDLAVRLAERSLSEGPGSGLLELIRARSGVTRISFVDGQGRGLWDSSRRVAPGQRDPYFGIANREISSVMHGKPLHLASFRDESGRTVQAFYAPVQAPQGPAVVRLLYEGSKVPGSAAPLQILLWVYAIVASGVLIYSVFQLSRSGGGGTLSGGDTGLMIDAFHGLIDRFKQKEEELQRLRHCAEERAEEVENYNENILQSVTSGVITFNREMQITTLNSAAESILRINRADVVGTSGEALFGTEGGVLRLIRRAVFEGNVVSRQELEMEVAGAERIWAGVSVSLLRDRNKSIIGTTLVFTDLTAIKRLQEQVEIQKRLTALGEMSAWIAHEFRNYMGTILALARLLSKGFKEDPVQQARIESIIGELSAMDRLINELLSYGKKTEIHLQPASVSELVYEVVDSFKESGKWGRIRVDIRIPSALPAVALDPILMRQALSNLFQNALEALEQMQGGAQGRIRIAGWARSSELILEISDNGQGIPPDHLNKIFLPFFTTKETGTGLGLALVHKIILSHNGRIEVKNQEEGGACFTLTLPLEGSREKWKQFSSSKIAKA